MHRPGRRHCRYHRFSRLPSQQNRQPAGTHTQTGAHRTPDRSYVRTVKTASGGTVVQIGAHWFVCTEPGILHPIPCVVSRVW